MKLVCVLGGGGIFGGRIARALAATQDFSVRVVGRDARRGEAFSREIGAEFLRADLTAPGALKAVLEGVALVIDAAGPFQGRDYALARACIDSGAHYLDLADARRFVTGIGELDTRARERGVFVGAGASSAPTITHALIESVASEFESIDELDLALSPGNQNPRGAATIGAVLGILGEPLKVWIEGAWHERRGWGDAAWLEFPPDVGRRRVHNCELPDLDLFPPHFGARTVRFRAGVELNLFNRTLSTLAFLRRLRVVPNLAPLAPLARDVSLWFFSRGSKNGALAVWVRGRRRNGEPLERKVALVTADDGPATPSAPAILLARKILLGAGLPAGARPCAGLLTLGELLAHLEPFGIWCARGDDAGAWNSRPEWTQRGR
jgi:saccharopine dehydrogenase-like NADP-dependent oxidoreductase